MILGVALDFYSLAIADPFLLKINMTADGFELLDQQLRKLGSIDVVGRADDMAILAYVDF